ncbi:MAG: ribokinase [Microcoleaceae cyanobacterium]|jgi:ribokinase
MSIIVFGSINIDLVAQTPRLPLPGETLMGNNFFSAPGGKGANQAVAASRLGVNTYLMGRVGNDNFGQELLANLAQNNVNTDGVFVDQNTHSGVATIAVETSGQNHIIVIPGANGNIDVSDVERVKDLLPRANLLLLQLEIPLSRVIDSAKFAQKLGVKVILDPAPVIDHLPADFYPLIDIITPNEIEASQLVGCAVHDEETATYAALELCRRGVKIALVKLGDRGVIYARENESFFLPAFRVHTVDTVACGDAFNGGLAAALDQGLSLKEAMIWGAVAGALCATKSGAQSAMPDRVSFDHFLKEEGRRKKEEGIGKKE